MIIDTLENAPVVSGASCINYPVRQGLCDKDYAISSGAPARSFIAHQNAAAALLSAPDSTPGLLVSRKRPLSVDVTSFHTATASLEATDQDEEYDTKKLKPSEETSEESSPSPTSVLGGLDRCELSLTSRRTLAGSSASSRGRDKTKKSIGLALKPDDFEKQLTALLLHSNMDPVEIARPVMGCRPENLNSAITSGHAAWEGTVKHKLSKTNTVELFGLSISLPLDLIESFPPTLFVYELLPNEACKGFITSGVPASCHFCCMSKDHLRNAYKMAEMKLCVSVLLQDCKLCFMPTLDSDGAQNITCLLQKTM